MLVMTDVTYDVLYAPLNIGGNTETYVILTFHNLYNIEVNIETITILLFYYLVILVSVSFLLLVLLLLLWSDWERVTYQVVKLIPIR